MHLSGGNFLGEICSTERGGAFRRGLERCHRRLATAHDGSEGTIPVHHLTRLGFLAPKTDSAETRVTNTPTHPRKNTRSGPPFNTERRVLEREVTIEIHRVGGPGGQHRNVTDSAVRLRHFPSGITVAAKDFRSQHRNRALAFDRLIRRLELLNRKPKVRVPTRKSRGAVERRLGEKKRRKTSKQRRQPVTDEM